MPSRTSALLPLLLLMSGVALAASPTTTRYMAAHMTRDLVAAMKSKVIPVELKNTILENARPEDRDFAKSIVVHWKAYSDREVQAEFDQLVIKDEYGVDVLKIRPDVSASPQDVDALGNRFVINGRVWSKPKTGSIEKSIRQFLKDNVAINEGRNSPLFARFLSPAAAFAADTTNFAKPVYLYVSLGGFLSEPKNLPPTAMILKNNPKDAIYDSRKGWDSFLHRDVAVQCTGSVARTKAKVGSTIADVESRPDGSVVLTFNNDKQKAKLLVTSKKFDAKTVQKAIEKIKSYNDTSERAVAEKVLADFDDVGCQALSPRQYIQARQTVEKAAAEKTLEQEEKMNRERAKAIVEYLQESYTESQTSNLLCDDVVVQTCLKSDCSALSAPAKSGNIFAWIPHETPNSIGRAKNWRPEDTKVAGAPITVDPQTDLPVLNGEGISGNDMREAKRLVTRAVEDEKSERADIKNAILSLRPLGQCCGEAECREKLAGKDLNLVPSTGSGATKK